MTSIEEARNDRILALGLLDAERRGDDEEIVVRLNAICDRLNLDGDDTEQGLTPAAAKAVEKFVTESLR